MAIPVTVNACVRTAGLVRSASAAKRYRTDGAGALNHSRNDELENILRQATTDAAHSEQRQADQQYWLASPAIARPSQRNLQDTLSQSVGAEGNAGHGKAGFGIMNSIDAEHREDQKDAE